MNSQNVCYLVPELACTSCYPGTTFYTVETCFKAALHNQIALSEIKLENYDLLKFKLFLKMYFSL